MRMHQTLVEVVNRLCNLRVFQAETPIEEDVDASMNFDELQRDSCISFDQYPKDFVISASERSYQHQHIINQKLQRSRELDCEKLSTNRISTDKAYRLQIEGRESKVTTMK